MQSRRFLFLCVLIFVAVAGGIVYWTNSGPDVARLLQESRKAMLRGDMDVATAKASLALSHEPDNVDALFLSARLAVEAREYEQAIEHLDQIPDDGSRTAIEARSLSANTFLFQLFDISRAEQEYDRVLAMDASNADAHNRLAWLLGVSGRTLEANRHALMMIKLDAFEFVHLAVLCLDHDRIREEEMLQRWAAYSPQDPNVVLAQAAFAQTAGEYRKAEELIAKVVAVRPDWGDAFARQGECLTQLEDGHGLSKWESALPEGLAEHPGVLAVRGLKAKKEGNLRNAAGHLLKAIRNAPADRKTNYLLGQVLQELKRPVDAKVFLDLATDLEAYERTVKTAWNTERLADIEKCAELAGQVGLEAESFAWSVVATRRQSTSPIIRQGVAKWDRRLSALNSELRLPSRLQVSADLSTFLDDDSRHTRSTNESSAGEATTFGDAMFREEAVARGLVFSYNNSGKPNKGTERLLETLGGGVGVIDFDQDGWPDVYLPQGGDFPVTAASAVTSSNQLYRNVRGTLFQNVTDAASQCDNLFSVGVSVGDFDNDGFPDVFVGNIGTNQLFHNNGDGTFTDVSSRIIGDSEAWSSSSVIVDVNKDSIPDIYSVNYLAGDDVLTRICESNGVPTSCLPQLFSSAQDQLFIGDGEGGFTDVTEASGLLLDGGNGLAVLAADFESSGSLGLFVANDVAPNFYFRSVGNSEAPAFMEEGVSRGLAVNGDAENEACMGVAAGDINGNGLLDIFVTNFENETNTLYGQSGSGYFSDATNSAALSGPSRKMLGFGTGLLDADLDGDLDLIVANGHINNYRSVDRAYKMPAQFFLNNGRGRFKEHEAGAALKSPRLGRGLATTDWNRDGRPDVLISDLAAGLQLLTNETKARGNWLRIRIIGDTSARDAVGARVEVKTTKNTIVRYLSVGSYLSSNQNDILIGLNGATEASSVNIRFLDGDTTSMTGIPPGTEVVIIQNDRVRTQRYQ